jgi:ribosomal protein L16 Arg81 hydroxylase
MVAPTVARTATAELTAAPMVTPAARTDTPKATVAPTVARTATAELTALPEQAAPTERQAGALRRVAACNLAQFAASHWDRSPLLSRAGELPGAFTDLLSPDAVDELVSRRGLRTPFLRMAKDGGVIAAAKYTRGGGAGAGSPDQVADDKVLSLLADGATLVLQGLHRTWPPVIDFANDLSRELGHPVQVNAYITPPQNQGFAAHYDVHDVFVLQVTGAKHWFVYEPVLIDPLPDQEWQTRSDQVAKRATETPVVDTVLEPGDAMYLPRGFIHAATALGEVSIHLTVGVHPVTRHRLVRTLLDSVRDDPQLRRSLPVGVDLGDPATLAPELAATIAALHRHLDTASPTDVAGVIASDLRNGTRAEPLAPLAALVLAADLGADTPLRLRRGVRISTSTDEQAVQLRLVDTVVQIPIAAESALKTILDGGTFTPSQLGGLDDEEQLVIARRLLREGVVVPASE